MVTELTLPSVSACYKAGHTQVERVPDELMISRYQWDINLSLLSSRRNVNTWLLSNLFSLLLHIREGKPRLGINRQMDHLSKPGKIAGDTWTKFNESLGVCIDFKCQLSFVWIKVFHCNFLFWGNINVNFLFNQKKDYCFLIRHILYNMKVLFFKVPLHFKRKAFLFR